MHGSLQDPAGNAVGVLQELVPQSCLAAILVLGTAPAGKDDRPHQGQGELVLLSATEVFIEYSWWGCLQCVVKDALLAC